MNNVEDYTTFQDAYDDLPSEGGTIFVPAGTYGYTSGNNKGQFRGLHITDKPVALVGEESASGGALSVVEPDTEHFTDSDAIFIERLGGCTIKNLWILYPDEMEDGAGRGIRWYAAGNEAQMSGLAIHNVTIQKSPNLAVECTCDDHPDNYVSRLEMIGCTLADARKGGSLFLGGAGSKNNVFERCEFNGPGYGGFHNVQGCEVHADSPTITAPDLTSVQEGDEVRGMGIAWGTTVESVDSSTQITLSLDAIADFYDPPTTLTFYRVSGPDAGQLPRGHVHLLRTSASRFSQCSFQGPGAQPAVSTDLVSNFLVLRDSYREALVSEEEAVHSFVINGMTNLLIDGFYHQFHDYPSLLLRTGPLGIGMSRIANIQLLSTDLTNGNVIDLAKGTDELILDNVIEIHYVTAVQRNIATTSVGVTRPTLITRLGGRSIPQLQAEIRPGTPGPIDVRGCTNTGTGTVSRPATGSSSYLDGCERIRVTSAAALNVSASLASDDRLVYRGNTAGRSGFYFCARFSVTPQGEENNAFVGLANDLDDILPQETPEGLLNVVGMACMASSWSNWKLIWNDDAGIVSTLNLGGDFPFGDGVYELELWTEPSGAVINYRVTRLDDDGVDPASGILDANLPAGNTTLAMRAEINTGATYDDPAVLDVLRLYAERDFQ